MAIDTAAKRRAVSSIGQVWIGPGVTPTGTINATARAVIGYNYGGIAIAAPVSLTAIIDLTANKRTLVLYAEDRSGRGVAVLWTYDDGTPMTYDDGAFMIADDMDGALTAKKRTVVLTAEKRT